MIFTWVGLGVCILFFVGLCWPGKQEGEKAKRLNPLPDHAYRGDLSAAHERIRALERENRELREIPDASEDVRILPDPGPYASDFTRLCLSRLPDDGRIAEHGRIMAGNGRKRPDYGQVVAGYVRIPAPIWSGTRIRRVPKPSGLKPGVRLAIEDGWGREEHGTVVCVFEHHVTVIMDEFRKLRDLKWIRES